MGATILALLSSLHTKLDALIARGANSIPPAQASEIASGLEAAIAKIDAATTPA